MSHEKIWLVTGPAEAWGLTSPKPPWPPVTLSWRPDGTRSGSRPRSAYTTICWLPPLTSPTPLPPRRPSGRPWTGSVASTCWSTTRATSTPDSSKNSAPDEFRAQIETTLFGPVNLARAVLPVMRAQRSGLVITISSTAGIAGGEFLTAYAASKFGVEGWQESLAPEVAPFGIRTMLVEPGFFRTELLTPESTKYAESSVADYAERTAQTVTAWKSMNGQQGGDPAKLADALVHLAALDEPPLRFPAGAARGRRVQEPGQAVPRTGRRPSRAVQQPRV